MQVVTLSLSVTPTELSLMFGLMDRIPGGVEPMLADLESYIVQNGLDDMKACADIITTVGHMTGAAHENCFLGGGGSPLAVV